MLDFRSYDDDNGTTRNVTLDLFGFEASGIIEYDDIEDVIYKMRVLQLFKKLLVILSNDF